MVNKQSAICGPTRLTGPASAAQGQLSCAPPSTAVGFGQEAALPPGRLDAAQPVVRPPERGARVTAEVVLAAEHGRHWTAEYRATPFAGPGGPVRASRVLHALLGLVPTGHRTGLLCPVLGLKCEAADWAILWRLRRPPPRFQVALVGTECLLLLTVLGMEGLAAVTARVDSVWVSHGPIVPPPAAAVKPNIELNPEYAAMIESNLKAECPLLMEATR